MTIPSILAPVFVQVALTFAAVRAGQVKVEDIALGQRAWPDRVMQVANSFHNQFETPLLFYALVAFALITRQADLVFVIMSWFYVLSRLAHAAIYTTSNVVRLRFQAALAGALVLMTMWIVFAVRILLAGA